MNNNIAPDISSIRKLAISETGFIFDPQTGHSYIVNEVGVEILNCLKKELPGKETIEHILDNYEISLDQVKRDYDSFIIKLKHYGLYKESKR
jgi:hypothetical protein